MKKNNETTSNFIKDIDINDLKEINFNTHSVYHAINVTEVKNVSASTKEFSTNIPVCTVIHLADKDENNNNRKGLIVIEKAQINELNLPFIKENLLPINPEELTRIISAHT